MLAILKNKNLLINVSWIALAILFIFGGLGDVTVAITFIGVLLSYALIYFLYLSRVKILLPKGLFSYTIFLVFFLISLIWSRVQTTSLIYFFMFLAGGLFWIFFYNFKGKTFLKMPYFDSMVVFLGLSFGTVTIYNLITKSTDFNPAGLTNYTFSNLNHHNIGDLWAAILGPLIFIFFKKSNNSFMTALLIVLGVFFLAISFSRSAYLSSIVGILYIMSEINMSRFIKNISYLFILLMSAMFMLSSMGKGLISHRLFFLSGFIDAFKQPFGVGIGAFGVALQSDQVLLNTFQYSNIAHNLLLDVVVGLGILSFPFLYWFYKIIKNFLQNTNSATVIYKLFFLILSVNFMFNYTYVIPVILWLWFASLGLWQSE